VLKNLFHGPLVGRVRVLTELREQISVKFIQLPDAIIGRFRQLNVGDEIDYRS
jgi:hypothetical protein